jgi:hypothetical protein
MGTASSTTNYTTIINNTIVSSVTTSLQNTGNQAFSIQNIKIDCNNPNYLEKKGKFMKECMKYWSNIYEDLEPQKMVKIIKQNCNNPWNCGASHIKMSGNLNANLTQEQVSQSMIDAQTAIENNINQKAQTTTGLFEFGQKTKNVIKDESTTITNAISENFQDISTSIGSVQTLEIESGTIKYISMDIVTKAISNFVQNNNTVINAVTTINNSIVQDASSKSIINGVVGKIIILFILFLGILGITLIIIKNIKKYK